MKIKIQIETHVYAEGKLCDEVLDLNLPNTVESCGILGPEIIGPLKRNQGAIYCYQYDENTTLGDIKDFILGKIGIGEIPWIAFLIGNKRYEIDDGNALFINVLNKYLKCDDYQGIRMGIYISQDAGTICKEGELRYMMHSRERGKHNVAHVHVSNTSYDYEAIISIIDGKVLAGTLPNKLLKHAQQKIMKDNQFFVNCWNTLTDGLRVDIDKHYGLIEY